MWRRYGSYLIALGFGLALWYPAVSILSVWFLRHRFDPSAAASAWLFTWWAAPDLSVHQTMMLRRGLFFGSLVALLPLATALFSPRREKLRPARNGEILPPPKRAYSTNLGGADWLSLPRLRKLFPGGTEQYGGICVGENYRVDLDRPREQAFDPDDKSTWGKGGRAELLIDPCKTGSTHVTVFSGSGGYKTVSFTITTMITWTGSAVVFDPPGQVAQQTAQLRRAMGHKVYEVGPGKMGMNVLKWIDVTDPMAEAYVEDVLTWLCGPVKAQKKGNDSKGGETFAASGRQMMVCLLADMLWDPKIPKEEKTLQLWFDTLTLPEHLLKGKLESIAKSSASRKARYSARTLHGLHPETFSGAYFHATTESGLMSTQVFADLLSNDDCDPSCVARERATIYVTIPMDTLETTPELARVIIASIQSAVRRANGKLATGRVLGWYEEARFLGELAPLASALTSDRKYGWTIGTVWQDEGDLKKIWGERSSIFTANSNWVAYAAVSEPATAENVSKRVGKFTVITQSAGAGSSNGGNRQNQSRNDGKSEQTRDLIRPEEVTTMRADEAILFYRGMPAARIGRAIYFRRPEMVAQIEPDRLRVAAE